MIKETILIVDDIPSNVQILAAILKDDYNIKVATSGIRAIEIANIEPHPDLILLDVVMPETDGYDVCISLKQALNTKDIPIIFVTANNETSDEEKGLSIGAVDYITKPVNPAIVKARVKTHLTIKRQYDELKLIAMQDKLTGLYNRHYLMDTAKSKLSSATRKNEHLCVMITDIDHFKSVNDTYGHLAGDEVLKAVASILKNDNREEDFVARYGGEEFVMIFDSCEITNAKNIAEKLREKIENANPQNIHITSSFGIVALTSKHKNFDMLLYDADLALYHAKNTGRNKVVIFDETMKPN